MAAKTVRHAEAAGGSVVLGVAVAPLVLVAGVVVVAAVVLGADLTSPSYEQKLSSAAMLE
jgi:hypothetical protein